MSEVPLFPLWVTVFLTIWAVVGPIVGIVAGHFLTRSWDRKKWLADNKRDEYREVIKVLSAALGPIIQCVMPGLLVGPEEIQERNITENASYEVLGSRIFIHDELEEINAYDRWVALVAQFQKHRDDKTFAKQFKELLADIRKAALKSTGAN